jgi:hypothetical protein
MRIGYHPEPSWWNELIDGFHGLRARLRDLAEDLHATFRWHQ